MHKFGLRLITAGQIIKALGQGKPQLGAFAKTANNHKK
jgi:hypothetical protein